MMATNTATIDAGPILHAVAIAFGVKGADILGHCRSHTIVTARSAFAWMLRQRGLSFPEIAREVGYRFHSSAMNATERIEEAIQRTRNVAWAAAQLGARPMTEDDQLVAARLETARLMLAGNP